ncbi:hypothetical protein BS47DRAFT_1332775 [Hydnum rufescens UP504]|uniref:Methyltransferase domain-containing protein n=1 Tax=Hydnum rufescens UP504 TaxID=1448309 RepID=A0A9P6AP16_9AGAM|nr:hypothetical protein BS47DRAFT_1332775 [Hydnum rufescens UP504]
MNGMSPKKSHEVHRLSTCIRDFIRECSPFVIDVGAGQGYLARELASPSIPSARPMHVLALDSDMDQIDGAKRRGGCSPGKREGCAHPDTDGSPCKCGSITYRNAFVSSDSLVQEIESWIASFPCDTQPHVGRTQSDHARTYPVIMTGLHACGSLTPTVLRSFVSLSDPDSAPPDSHSSGIQWKPSALALVGCCYNLMKESDFPMTCWDGFAPLKLTRQHLQLACQCPYQWTLSDASWRGSRLSRKKVVYRALLGRLLSQHAQAAPDVLLQGKKLGRLNSSAYASWSTFLQQTSSRLGLSDILDPDYHLGLEPGHGFPEEFPRLAPRLACLHAMRSLLGPVIESVIIADRIVYLVDHLRPNWNIHAVNVFDLASGSARNVALVVDQPIDDGQG